MPPVNYKTFIDQERAAKGVPTPVIPSSKKRLLHMLDASTYTAKQWRNY